MADYATTAPWLEDLSKPVTAQVGLSDEERQRISNMARRGIQGSTKMAAAEAGQAMGARGVQPGNSGLADNAIGKIWQGGAQQLSDFRSNQAIDETNKRFDQNMQLNNANLGRQQAGGGLAMSYEQMLANQRAQAAAASSGASRDAQQQANWEKQFGREGEQIAWGQEQQDYQNMIDYMNQMQGAQNDIWAPYYGAVAGANG